MQEHSRTYAGPVRIGFRVHGCHDNFASNFPQSDTEQKRLLSFAACHLAWGFDTRVCVGQLGDHEVHALPKLVVRRRRQCERFPVRAGGQPIDAVQISAVVTLVDSRPHRIHRRTTRCGG